MRTGTMMLALLGTALGGGGAAILHATPPAAAATAASPALVFADAARLDQVRASVAAKDGRFAKSVAALVKRADAALARPLDPVTAKTQTPPSGDKHDYLSLAPYWWPNPASADGMPWLVKDGEVNPMTRGAHTDKDRLSRMLGDVDDLWVAYYVTDDARYRAKLDAILTGWFVDPATRVNPNANFGQGVPGVAAGRQSGLIEWNGIDAVVSAAQLMKARSGWAPAKQAAMDKWLADFLGWMRTSEIGRDCDTGNNNHANWYDYKLIGLALHAGQHDVARDQAEKAKLRRISAQIHPDGRQPQELWRTKSMSYSTMNLRAMTEVALLAKKVDVDLLGYSSADGKSIAAAYRYLTPFANGSGGWMYPQITKGGPDAAVEETLRPWFAQAEMMLGREMLTPAARTAALTQFSPRERILLAIPD